jgi:NADPH-dependent F420 reductase
MTTIAVIGGTGRLGSGLAARWARAGRDVIIGSRQAAKARAAAERTPIKAAGGSIRGAVNPEAAAAADIVVLTIPFSAHTAILPDLRDAVRGKAVVDTTVPLQQYAPPLLAPVTAGSAAAQVQAFLPEARVVAGFHTVSEALAANLDRPLEGDVLLCGDDAAAKGTVSELVAALGMRAFDVGELGHAATLERLAALIMGLNQRYRRKAIGVRLTGI